MYIPKYNYEIKGIFFNSLNVKHLHLLCFPIPKKETFVDKKIHVILEQVLEVIKKIRLVKRHVFFRLNVPKPKFMNYLLFRDDGVIYKHSIALIKK